MGASGQDANFNVADLGVGSQDLLRSLAAELKLPLTHISGTASLLLEEQLDAPGAGEHLKRIVLSSDRLLELIDGLLLSGRIQAHQAELQLEPVNMSAVLHDVSDQLLPLAKRYHHTIELSGTQKLHPVMADRRALNAVVFGLLDNAILSSQRGTPIRLYVRRRHDGIRLTLQDHGDRLSQQEIMASLRRLKHAAQPFKTLVTSKGLGLYIAVHLTNEMRGRLWSVTTEDTRSLALQLPLSQQTSLFA